MKTLSAHIKYTPMTIAEAYELYKHLDHLLADTKLSDSFEGCILNDLWLAIRAAQTGAQGEYCECPSCHATGLPELFMRRR